MATFELSATFGSSFSASDTVLLSVSSGTISPLSSTKGDLATGITVTCNAGVTITAEITSGTCDGVTSTAVANAVTPTPTATTVGPTPTPTPTPTISPTPTPSPVLFSFAVTAYDSVKNDVCFIPVVTTVYTDEFTSWANITSGDRIYTDSGLTTEIYGGNNFYGMNDGLTGTTTYTFRYSTGFGVDQVDNCGSSPTPTPTQTPTPTPTPNAFNFIITAYDSIQGTACGNALSQSVYTYDFNNFSEIVSSDRIYSDEAATTEIYGGNNYYGMSDSVSGSTTDYYFRYSTGFGVDAKGSCGTPTPTPTPTTSPTPTPTPTPTISPTPTPTNLTANWFTGNVEGTGGATAGAACGALVRDYYVIYSATRTNPFDSIVGDVVYSDVVQTPYAGDSEWYAFGTTANTLGGAAYQIDNTGTILTITGCGTPTPTPTTTATSTPTPTPTPTGAAWVPAGYNWFGDNQAVRDRAGTLTIMEVKMPTTDQYWSIGEWMTYTQNAGTTFVPTVGNEGTLYDLYQSSSYFAVVSASLEGNLTEKGRVGYGVSTPKVAWEDMQSAESWRGTQTYFTTFNAGQWSYAETATAGTWYGSERILWKYGLVPNILDATGSVPTTPATTGSCNDWFYLGGQDAAGPVTVQYNPTLVGYELKWGNNDYSNTSTLTRVNETLQYMVRGHITGSDLNENTAYAIADLNGNPCARTGITIYSQSLENVVTPVAVMDFDGGSPNAYWQGVEAEYANRIIVRQMPTTGVWADESQHPFMWLDWENTYEKANLWMRINAAID